MTLSFDQPAPRGLDAMLIVYSLLDDHPASSVCESFIRERTDWLTTTLTLLEAKAILTKVYAVETNLTSQQLSQFSAGPIEIVEVDLPITLVAMSIADTLAIDITDAVLVQATRTRNANVPYQSSVCSRETILRCAHPGECHKAFIPLIHAKCIIARLFKMCENNYGRYNKWQLGLQ